MTKRRLVNKNIISNLRQRWEAELKPHSDAALSAMYEDFASSDEFGDNDAKLPLWFGMLPDYEIEVAL